MTPPARGKDANVLEALNLARGSIRTARIEHGRAIEKLRAVKLATNRRNGSGEYDRAVKAITAAQQALVATDKLTDAALDCIGITEGWL